MVRGAPGRAAAAPGAAAAAAMAGRRRPARPGPHPPNFEEMLRRSQERFRRCLPGGFDIGTGIWRSPSLVIVVLWLASGFYRVQPDEVGVVLRFGAYNRTDPARASTTTCRRRSRAC